MDLYLIANKSLEILNYHLFNGYRITTTEIPFIIIQTRLIREPIIFITI